MLAYFRGGSWKLVVINREETQADAKASLIIRGDIEKVMDAIAINV